MRRKSEKILSEVEPVKFSLSYLVFKIKKFFRGIKR